MASTFAILRSSLLFTVLVGLVGCAPQARCDRQDGAQQTGAGGEAAPPSSAPSTESGSASPESSASPTEGVVRPASAIERRAAPNGKAHIDLLARGQNAFIGRLEMVPNAAVPEHQDPTEEYIYVLEGTGTMTMDGQTFEVGPGSVIFMPAFAKVKFQNGPAKMVAVQVFAGPAPADKYNAWTPAAE